MIKTFCMLNFWFCSMLLLFACGGNDEGQGKIDQICSYPTELNVGYEQSTQTLEITSTCDWTAFSDDVWLTCQASGTTQNKGILKVLISSNPTTSIREGIVTLKAGSARFTIKVKQDPKTKPPVDPNINVPAGYELVWNEEFNEGTQPNTDKWWYETGDNGWGNNEIQYYVSGNYQGDNLALINDGSLNIICKKINNKVYSIRINTRDSWQYGYFEAKLKLPLGKGTWPAFWMMPKNFTSWPGDGEIDIMEHVGYNPNVVSSAIHSNAYNHKDGTQKTKEKFLATAQTEYHVYALEWTEDFIRTYVDGEVLFTFLNDKSGSKDTWPFNAPFYLKLNLAWGGDWGGAMGVDETALPAIYQIDYVRVFQKINN